MVPTQHITGAGRESRPAQVRVWDPFVRIFHWSLAALFAFAFLTGDEWDRAHMAAGYAIAGLVTLRVIWGFVGPRRARFCDFVHPPVTVVAYLGDMARLRARRHLGHNPAGGAMILALLTALAATALTGHLTTTDAFWGIEWMEDLHEAVAHVTPVLVGLHVAGVVATSLEHGENLVRAMITGSKRPD